jgi:AAA+ ATPase superfamily predicted ATPase
MFANRKNELENLRNALESKKPEFVVIYGRRRVGKTELLKQILQLREDAVYFLGREEAPHDMLARLSAITAEGFQDEKLRRFPFKNLDEAFYYFSERKKAVLIFDEFPYMAVSDPKLPSVMQGFCDNEMKNTKIKIFACGSSMGMVEKSLFSHTAPLYGRRTRQMKIEPMKFSALKEFFPKSSFEELLGIYAVLGGTPAYLLEFEKDIFTTIKNKFMAKDQLLYKDAEFVLREELSEPRYYFSIIRSIASGNTSLGHIMNDTGLSKDVVSKYLVTLQDLDIIERMWPITEHPKSRKGIYRIKDNYFRFYFRFIFPNLEYIEIGEIDFLLEKIKEEYNNYLGGIFEDVLIEIFKERRDLLPFKPTRIGRWWGKGQEIDLVGVDERHDKILFLEAKYSAKKVGKQLFFDLLKKTKNVKWGSKNRKEYFVLISKSGFVKNLKGEDVSCFKMDDINKMMGGPGKS